METTARALVANARTSAGVMAVSKVDEYLANASYCERQANAARDGGIKAEYLKLPRKWRELAREFDHPKSN